MKITNEINPSAPLTPTERVRLGAFMLWPLLFVLAIGILCGGCKEFHENAGSHTKVRSLTAPIEVSDGSDSITMKALYSMDGADVYTPKDSLVEITYRNTYTNNYFAIIKTSGKQELEVKIEPIATDTDGGAATNITQEAAK